MESTHLKNFITKLNDRNLQRKRESGITSYVLLSVLIFCSYKFYKNFSFYFLNNLNLNIQEAIHLVCFTSNSMVALYFILLTFQTEKKTFSNLKVLKYDKENFNLFGYIIMLFLLLIPIISTFNSYLNIKKDFNEYYYWYLGILNLFSFFFLFEPIKTSKKQLKIINSKNDDIGLKIFVIVISIVVIIFSIIQAINIIIPEKFIFVKIIILFYIILLIMEKIVEQEKNDINTFNLENFEYEIYLKNLNDDEIREKLQNNYIGYLIEYWIDLNKSELKDFKEKIELQKIELNNEILKLEITVDKQKYPIEFEARKKNITENLNKEIKIKLPYFEKKLSEIGKIVIDGKNLNENELSELTQLKNNLNSIINEFK